MTEGQSKQHWVQPNIGTKTTIGFDLSVRCKTSGKLSILVKELFGHAGNSMKRSKFGIFCNISNISNISNIKASVFYRILESSETRVF